MNDLDKPVFEQTLRGIAEIFSTTKKVVINIPLLQIYFMTLSDYSYQEVEWAIGQHMKDSKCGSFFPKPADIIRQLDANKPNTEDKATLAWNQIIREMRKHGAYDPLELDDKQALAAIAAVKSWKDLCAMPEKDLTWAKKEFMANYITYENTPLELLPSSLPGLVQLHEHKNQEKEAYAKITDGVDSFRANLIINNKGE